MVPITATPPRTMAARTSRPTRRASGSPTWKVRYNVTDQLQFAIGANNLFNIRPDVVRRCAELLGTAGERDHCHRRQLA